MTVTRLLFGFSGRAGRLHFWLGQIAIVGLILFMAGIGSITLGSLKTATTPQQVLSALGIMLLVVLGAMILLLWVGWAVVVKRLHDRNKSGMWVLPALIPTVLLLWVGFSDGLLAMLAFESSTLFRILQLVMLVWYVVELGVLKGTPGGNVYGPSPIAEAGGDDIEARMLAEVAGGKSAKAEAPAPLTAARVAVAVVRKPKSGPAREPSRGFGRRGAPA